MTDSQPLDRWRYPVDLHMVVYPPKSDKPYQVLVLDERTGQTEKINDGEGYLSAELEPFVQAGEAWFELFGEGDD